MGGNFNFYLIKEPVTKSEAIARFEDHAAQSRYESGHSYSGGIGMKRELIDGPQDFEDEATASQWVMAHNEKWGPGHLVRLKDGRYGYGGWCSS